MARSAFPRLVIFAYISASPAAYSAQQNMSVVRIIDQQGAPISMAEVKMTSGKKTDDALSDDKGYVPLDPGLWKDRELIHLDVSAAGYGDASSNFNRKSATSLTIQLKPVTNEADIVVVAKKISRPFSPKTIDFLDIITDPRAGADPILAVNDLPASTNVTGNSHLTLHGSRTAISRAYLNNVPVYEFSSGSEVDTSTQNRSVFNLVVADEVETYPENPPAYLAGATGGVVRVVTPDNKTSGSTISLTTLGVSGGHVFGSKSGDNFLALYGSLTDLTLYKDINPKLSSIYGSVRSANGGSLAHLATNNGASINLFIQGESASDSFPFEIFNKKSIFRLKPTKERSVVSGTMPLAGFVVSANIAFTRSDITEVFSNSRVQSTNSYGFGSIDATHGWLRGDFRLRFGVDVEFIKQASDMALATSGNPKSANQTSNASHSTLQQMTSYLFATYRQSDMLMFSAGMRLPIVTNIYPDLSVQASVTLLSPDRRHKLIMSAGHYGGDEVPTRAYYGRISKSLSHQISADYSWKLHSNTLGFSAFFAREKTYGDAFDTKSLFVSDDIDNLTGIGRLTKSEGIEAYAGWMPITGLEAKISFSKVHQVMWLSGERLRGDNDYPSIIRAGLKYTTPMQSSYSLDFTSRTGQPYTRADGSTFLFGEPIPLYGPINATRLPNYMSLDASISQHIHLPLLRDGSIIFVALNNITNHRNPSAQVLTFLRNVTNYRYMSGRSLLFGFTTSF